MNTVQLRRVATQSDRKLPDSTPAGYTFRYIEISAVGSDGQVVVPDDTITFGEAPSRARKLAGPDSVLISTVRTYLRAIAKSPADENLVYSTGFAVIDPVGEGDPRYLAYACRADSFVEEVVARSVGVSYPAINPSDLMAVPVSMVPVDEQRRIADFLDDCAYRIDNIIAARRSQADHVQVARGAESSDLVERLAERFGLAPLRRFASGIEQGSSPVADSVPAGVGEAGVIMTSAIQAGSFDPSRNKLVADRQDLTEAARVSRGDLLAVRGSGSADLVGDVAAVGSLSGSADLYLSDLTYRVKRPVMDTDFLSACLLVPRARAQLRALVRQGTGPAKARGEDILSLRVPVAPQPAQAELVRAVRSIDETHRALDESLDESVQLLTEYKQSLITAAVTGELDVTTASTRVPA